MKVTINKMNLFHLFLSNFLLNNCFSFVQDEIGDHMKKTIIIILLAMLGFYFLSMKGSALIIPNEAIRLRVLANSNSKEDQELKLKVRDELQLYMYELLKDTKGIDQAREKIKQNLDQIEDCVNRTLQKYDSAIKFQVDFGLNYFPDKEYKGVVYPAGEYESVLVTLGEGNGNNWWCVLFPPLCLMEAEESDTVEYKSFFQELIEKYFIGGDVHGIFSYLRSCS